jgi:hypothetical protein
MYVPYIAQIDGIAKITDQNILDVIYGLAQAPIYVLTNPVTQDAYIREARPTLNYGANQSLVIGDAVDGRYRTYIQIDVTPYNNLADSFIISGDLVLDVSGAYDKTQIIDAYLVDSSWTEMSITWSSALNITAEINPLFSFTCDSSEVRINLLDYLNYMKTEKIPTLNLVLRARDESDSNLFNFFSKDSTKVESHPRIEVQYQDLVWTAFTDKIELDSSVTVVSRNNKDITGSGIARQQDWGKFFLTSSALIGVFEESDLAGSTIVRGNTRVDLDSSSNINSVVDLDSSTTSRGNDNIELLSSVLAVFSSDIESDITVTPATDLIGSINVVANNQIDSSVDVTPVSDLLSTVNARLDINLFSIAEIAGNLLYLDGSANIRPQKEITGQATVAYSTDINSTATARISKNTDLFGSGIVRRTDIRDLDGSATVRSSSDLLSYVMAGIWPIDIDSTATIVKTGNKDLPSTSDIWYYNLLDGIVTIIPTKDLDGRVTVAQNINLDGTSNIIATKNLIGATIVRRFDSSILEGSAIIRRLDIMEMDSSVYVFGLFSQSIDSEVIVRQIGRDFIDCLADVETSSRQWVPNIHGIDVFTYQDRKLPREWKREIFIP